jgi:hypothetical protein
MPEVMVKVLSRGGQDLKAVGRHIDYLRHRADGELEIETDDGQRVSGERVTKDLLTDWDLELDERRGRADLGARACGSKKLVHKLLFSMPPGSPSDKVLTAVRNFAREEFGLKHRYAIVLHTDEPHPHVHMVLKAVSEQGSRLHIRKATLRHWRREFARHLRELGVAANATERAVRGQARGAKADGIYRTRLRGVSTHMFDRVSAVARELAKGVRADHFRSGKLLRTRGEVERGWNAVSADLANQGHSDLAAEVHRFVRGMPPPQSEQESVAKELISRMSPKRSIEPSARR